MAEILSTAEYKTLRGIDNTDRDAQIDAVKPLAEDTIQQQLERPILADPVVETRKFRYEGPIVNIDDAAAISAVSVGGRSLTADIHYTAEPGKADQPDWWLDLGHHAGRRGSPEMGFTRNEDVLGSRDILFVTVTAEWGWAEIPPALKMAVALLLDQVSYPTDEERDVSARAVADTSIVYDSAEPERRPVVPTNAINNLLKPYRRIQL